MRITTIVGARPQFIKAATVSRAIQEHNQKGGVTNFIEEKIIHTGQHFDSNMSEIFFKELHIPPPDLFLGINSMSHGAMTGRMLEKIEKILLDDRPDWVLVYGDTNSTLAGALAAVKLHIPVAHVEAGLRSFNPDMPEEINRVMTDHMSSILFCPTTVAVDNLETEGIKKGVKRVGDVMFDAFLYYQTVNNDRESCLQKFGLRPGNYCLATVHREENTDNSDRLMAILAALDGIGLEDKPVILPIHPRTRKAVDNLNIKLSEFENIRAIEPVGYLDMIALESQSFAVLTDSGGVQKEAFFSQVPCITLRDETEWVETVESGWNILAGADKENIIKSFGSVKMFADRQAPPLYGDGRAAQKIIKSIIEHE